MYNVLMSYYKTPRTSRVRQLRLRVVPVKFRWVLISVCHVSLLAGQSHEHRTLFRIMAWFWCPMVNKDTAHFITACAHCKLVNSFSPEAQQFLQTIESDTPFDEVFIDFWEPRDIPDRDGYRNILTYLDCLTVCGLSSILAQFWWPVVKKEVAQFIRSCAHCK